MKSRFLVFTFFVTISSLAGVVSGLCSTPITVLNITGHTSISDSSFPMISGMTLVWQAKGGLAGTSSGGSDWEIFLYDLVNETLIQLTDDDGDDLSPQTDGDYVVWQKHTAGHGNQIYLYQIQASGPAGGSKISINDSLDNYAPRITAARIVWTAQAVTNAFQPGQIMFYDAAAGTGPVVISNPGIDCSNPRIDPQQVTWIQQRSDKTESLYLYDLTSNPPKGHLAPNNFIWNKNHAVDHQQKVLTRYDGTDREIVLHNTTEGYVQITANTYADASPVISRNHIAWVADGDIYLADIAQFMHVQVPDEFTGKGTGFPASWSELTDKVDAYYLDVSTDPNFKSFVDGYRALNVGTDTLYWVEGLDPDTTYYYRVYARVNGSATAQSKTSTVKLKQAISSLPAGVEALPFIYRLLL